MDIPMIIALAVILLFGVLGYRDGVVKRIIEIAGVFVALYLTARFATAVAPWVMEQTGVGESPALLLTWAGLFILGLVLSRLLALVLSKLIRLTILGPLDKFGGALVGLAFGTLLVSVLLLAGSQAPGGDKIQSSFDRTAPGRFIYYAAPNIYRAVRGLGGGEADDIWNRVLDSTKEQVGAVGDQVRDAVDSATDDFKADVRQKVEEDLKEEVKKKMEELEKNQSKKDSGG
jgi:uncharacterized protein YjbJ (UPF0337 family)